MPKMIPFGKGTRGLLLWSIIPAAFIGPGTVTTCARAGADFGTALLWALTFSVLATMVLQEAAARITIASGKTLGQVVAARFGQGPARWLRVALFGAVALGCTAYQAGNLLGAVAGFQLISSVPTAWWLLLIGTLATALLWSGSTRLLTSVLAVVVFFMGIAFVVAGVQAPVTLTEVLKGAFVPTIPSGGALLVIGLVGTTVVPYNLFLGSGLGRGQQMAEMRMGLLAAIAIGGFISACILLTGLQIEGAFSFEGLGATLEARLGSGTSKLFALGLMAAGLSSAITAPFAAAITGQTLLGDAADGWKTTGRHFRTTWLVVLGAGWLFALTGVKPIPAIVAAQAANGFLLPFVAVFLWVVVNDRRLMPPAYRNGWKANVLMGVVVAVVTLLGAYNIWKAFT